MAAKVPKFARTDPSGARAPLEPDVAIRCQAVDSGARNASTVWRQVATPGQVATKGASIDALGANR